MNQHLVCQKKEEPWVHEFYKESVICPSLKYFHKICKRTGGYWERRSGNCIEFFVQFCIGSV